MARKIELGAPSFMMAVAASIAAVFADAVYPIKVVITNNMPRDIALPDVGVFLRHVCNPDGENQREVEIQSIDQLLRLESNIGQISFLNDYQYAAMTVEDAADKEAEAKVLAEAEAARVQVELDAAAESAKDDAEKAEAEKAAAEAEAKAKAEAESKTGDETGGDETGTGDETGSTGSGDDPEGETDGSEAEKDANPDAPEKKAAKTKKGDK